MTPLTTFSIYVLPRSSSGRFRILSKHATLLCFEAGSPAAFVRSAALRATLAGSLPLSARQNLYYNLRFQSLALLWESPEAPSRLLTLLPSLNHQRALKCALLHELLFEKDLAKEFLGESALLQIECL